MFIYLSPVFCLIHGIILLIFLGNFRKPHSHGCAVFFVQYYRSEKSPLFAVFLNVSYAKNPRESAFDALIFWNATITPCIRKVYRAFIKRNKIFVFYTFDVLYKFPAFFRDIRTQDKLSFFEGIVKPNKPFAKGGFG